MERSLAMISHIAKDFYINRIYIHQIKGTAMRTKSAVVGNYLVVL